MPHTSTKTSTNVRVSVRAPALRPIVDALVRAKTDRKDVRAFITAALLAKEGKDACPRCGDALDLVRYRATRTSYFAREEIDCTSCATTFVLFENAVE